MRTCRTTIPLSYRAITLSPPITLSLAISIEPDFARARPGQIQRVGTTKSGNTKKIKPQVCRSKVNHIHSPHSFSDCNRWVERLSSSYGVLIVQGNYCSSLKNYKVLLSSPPTNNSDFDLKGTMLLSESLEPLQMYVPMCIPRTGSNVMVYPLLDQPRFSSNFQVGVVTDVQDIVTLLKK